MSRKSTTVISRNYSSETLAVTQPSNYAITSTELLTPIEGDPPMFIGRGRPRNPITTSVYNHLISHRNVWFHVNLSFTDKKQVGSFRTSLYVRAAKDNLKISSSSMYNESTKTYDVWVILF
jgi:hypothetical protein